MTTSKRRIRSSIQRASQQPPAVGDCPRVVHRVCVHASIAVCAARTFRTQPKDLHLLFFSQAHSRGEEYRLPGCWFLRTGCSPCSRQSVPGGRHLFGRQALWCPGTSHEGQNDAPPFLKPSPATAYSWNTPEQSSFANSRERGLPVSSSKNKGILRHCPFAVWL